MVWTCIQEFNFLFLLNAKIIYCWKLRSCMIVIFLLIGLNIQFDRKLKEKKNPTKFEWGLERQQRDLKRTDLMKKKRNVLAFSSNQSRISEKQEISEGHCNKIKRVDKRIHSHFESCVGKDKVVMFFIWDYNEKTRITDLMPLWEFNFSVTTNCTSSLAKHFENTWYVELIHRVDSMTVCG